MSNSSSTRAAQAALIAAANAARAVARTEGPGTRFQEAAIAAALAAASASGPVTRRRARIAGLTAAQLAAAAAQPRITGQRRAREGGIENPGAGAGKVARLGGESSDGGFERVPMGFFASVPRELLPRMFELLSVDDLFGRFAVTSRELRDLVYTGVLFREKVVEMFQNGDYPQAFIAIEAIQSRPYLPAVKQRILGEVVVESGEGAAAAAVAAVVVSEPEISVNETAKSTDLVALATKSRRLIDAVLSQIFDDDAQTGHFLCGPNLRKVILGQSDEIEGENLPLFFRHIEQNMNALLALESLSDEESSMRGAIVLHYIGYILHTDAEIFEAQDDAWKVTSILNALCGFLTESDDSSKKNALINAFNAWPSLAIGMLDKIAETDDLEVEVLQMLLLIVSDAAVEKKSFKVQTEGSGASAAASAAAATASAASGEGDDEEEKVVVPAVVCQEVVVHALGLLQQLSPELFKQVAMNFAESITDESVKMRLQTFLEKASLIWAEEPEDSESSGDSEYSDASESDDDYDNPFGQFSQYPYSDSDSDSSW